MLTVDLAIPPSYNHCIAHTPFGGIPTRPYANWLNDAHSAIRAAMLDAGLETDAEGWWRVRIAIYCGMGRRGDVDGYAKPILDALGGARQNEKRKIERVGLVYRDDTQVAELHVRLVAVRMRNEESYVSVSCERTASPIDRVEAEKQARRRAREAKRGVRHPCSTAT